MDRSPSFSLIFKRVLPAATLFFIPPLAHAHPGMIGHTHGFLNGLAHPLTGPDHICAMLAIGLWAAQRGGRALWLLPSTFVSLMIAGGAMGMAGNPVGWTEPGIAASVLVLGLLIAGSVRMPLSVSMLLSGGFALFHGYAHGAEMPVTASGLAYGAGFVVATAGLHLFGIGLGLLLKNFAGTRGYRLAGGAVAACGVYFCLLL